MNRAFVEELRERSKLDRAIIVGSEIRGLINIIDQQDKLIEQIDQTLQVPAAEYVPAIGMVFKLIDEYRKAGEQ